MKTNHPIFNALLLWIVFLLHVHTVSAQNRRTAIEFDGTDNAAITDLRNCLKDYSAGTVTITKVPLDNRTGQEFFLASSSGNTQIKYTTQNSLENAVYTLLDAWGFHWYGPGDNWFVKPKALQIKNIAGVWIKPSFRNRSFFGTGGLDFGKQQPYDPQNQYKAQWYAWKRRSRFNADFAAIGHTGQAFYLANKPLLDAHPEWFANETGKRNGRIKIDQPGAVDAYKNWVHANYEKSKSPFIALGVDPEDGRGGADDPLPARMPGIKNNADKWWWLANEVAKGYPENDRKVVITAYAYGDGPYNALAPAFPLRKNVYPVIIPYAFQKAYLPDEMVRVWSTRVSGNMGIYDYWNITQWSLGLPQFNIYTIPAKLQFWNKNRIDGVYLETTDAAGPMGHALWLAGQLQWNVNGRFEKLYQQYLTDCFGNASGVMRRMFDRWSKNNQGAAEVTFSLNDLKEASALVGTNSPEWKRINELKAYVHFMKLYYEHDGTQESKNRIFNYIYSIHHLMMVQTAAFVGQYYISPLNKGNIVPDGNGIRPLSMDAIDQQFRRDCSEGKTAYKLTDFQFDPGKIKYTTPIPENVWLYGGFQCNFYFKAPVSGTLQFDAGAQSVTTLSVFSAEKKFINDKPGKANADYTETINGNVWGMKRYKLQIEKGKTYFINLTGGFSRVKIITPGIVLLKTPGAQDFDNYAYPPQYFYVPAATADIVFYDAEQKNGKSSGYLVTPDGKRIQGEPTGTANLYHVIAEPGYRGKTWKATFPHPTWSFKNIPNVTSLQQFDYKE